MSNERKGNFTGADAEHPASGTAILKENVVQFSEYEAGDAPDPKVYLTKNGDVQGGVALGDLPKGSKSFDLTIPEGTHTSEFDTVTVHCGEFNVGLSSAKLN